MRAVAAVLLLSLLACSGCMSQACRPCGPGFLGNLGIPQGIADVDFRESCRCHDECYSTDCPRKECDVAFRDNMLSQCECSTHPTLCKLRAWNWYTITRLGGAPGYWQSQRDRCCE